MPLFKTTIYQRLTGEGVTAEGWTNSFWVDALGMSSALGAGEAAAGVLMTQSIEEVSAWKVTARQAEGGPTGTRLIDVPGERTGMAVNLIPLFNSVRMTFADEVGRSETHYLRGYILEANVQGSKISGELRDAMQTDVADALLTVLGLRGPQGEEILSATIAQEIQMRQLSWSRRPRPGFKRGWVPV